MRFADRRLDSDYLLYDAVHFPECQREELDDSLRFSNWHNGLHGGRFADALVDLAFARSFGCFRSDQPGPCRLGSSSPANRNTATERKSGCYSDRNSHHFAADDAIAYGDSYTVSFSHPESDRFADSNSGSDCEPYVDSKILPSRRTTGNQSVYLRSVAVSAGEQRKVQSPITVMETTQRHGQDGFTLIEVIISMVILLIVVLGAFSMLVAAINLNAGNKARSQATAVLQQEVERYRSAKFNSTTTDSLESPISPDLCRLDGLRDLRGRERSECLVIANDGSGRTYTVSSVVDNQPSVHDIQTESYSCKSPQDVVIPCTIKEITIEVHLAEPNPGWQTAVPVRAIFRRVRGN
jgi:prepilin-type N-terminal cleavage/methylation domain-containing protein